MSKKDLRCKRPNMISNWLSRLKRGFKVYSRSAWNKSNPKKWHRNRRTRYNQTKFTKEERRFKIFISLSLGLVFAVLIAFYTEYFLILIGIYLGILYLLEFWIIGRKESSYRKKTQFTKR